MVTRAASEPLPAALPAATVILLRETTGEPETLLLRRDERGAFAGMWVFPGGRVDDADLDDDHPDDEVAAARRAAVREAFEEAGLVVDPASLVPFARWEPPPLVPKRFATWFFVGMTPSGEVVVDGAEVHEHLWIPPGEALQRHRDGDLALAPPTWVTLHQLSALGQAEDVLQHARAHEPERFRTHPIKVGEVAVLTWHGDAAYGAEEDTPGARHRLWMVEGAWRYERTTA